MTLAGCRLFTMNVTQISYSASNLLYFYSSESSELRQLVAFLTKKRHSYLPSHRQESQSIVPYRHIHRNSLPAVSRSAARAMRQMRGLRRYSVPVTINNPKQVNIAADGGQQVNVQNKSGAKNRKRKTASNKPQPILKAAR
jgi:hypothetical protein